MKISWSNKFYSILLHLGKHFVFKQKSHSDGVNGNTDSQTVPIYVIATLWYINQYCLAISKLTVLVKTGLVTQKVCVS